VPHVRDGGNYDMTGKEILLRSTVAISMGTWTRPAFIENDAYTSYYCWNKILEPTKTLFEGDCMRVSGSRLDSSVYLGKYVTVHVCVTTPYDVNGRLRSISGRLDPLWLGGDTKCWYTASTGRVVR
jgi:hypothetical protein